MNDSHRGPRALELLVCFDGAVLSAHQLLVGDALDTHDLELASEADRAPLAGVDADGAWIAWPEGTTGDVTVSGPAGDAVRTLEELARSGLALPDSVGAERTRRYTLPDGARAAVDLGPLTLLFHASEAERRIPPARSVEWCAHKWTAIVAGGCALAMVMAFSVPPDSAMASSDLSRLTNEQIHARFLPSVEPPTVAVGLPQKAPPGASPTRGKQGVLGKPEHVSKSGHVAIRGTAPVTHIAGGTDVRALAQSSGILQLLGHERGGALGAVLDPNEKALGDAAVAFEGNLDGLQAGPGWGTNGGGIVGTGPGGGCEGPSCGGTVSVGELCPGGICGGGTRHGRDPYAALPHGLERHRPAGVEILKTEVKVPAGMDKETIRRVIHAHMNEIRFCYEKELAGHPEIEGKLLMSFLVMRDGRVSSVQSLSSTLSDPAVGACVGQTLGRLSFPMPPSAQVASVQYPFLFRHAGQ